MAKKKKAMPAREHFMGKRFGRLGVGAHTNDGPQWSGLEPVE